MNAASPRAGRRVGIASQVFIGLGLGVLVGLFFGERVAFLRVGGDAFIALLQITVMPYVVVALITSLGRLTLVEAKALGLKAGGILLGRVDERHRGRSRSFSRLWCGGRAVWLRVI